MNNNQAELEINSPLYVQRDGGSVTTVGVASCYVELHEPCGKRSVAYAVSIKHSFSREGAPVCTGDEGAFVSVGTIDDAIIHNALSNSKPSSLNSSLLSLGLVRLKDSVHFSNKCKGHICPDFASASQYILKNNNKLYINGQAVGSIQEIFQDIELEFSDKKISEIEVFRAAIFKSAQNRANDLPIGSLAQLSSGEGVGFLVGRDERNLYFIDAKTLSKRVGLELVPAIEP